jgi:hypothetical protein
MFIKPESRALRALFWVLVVLVPGGFLLLALMGADVVHRRLRQEAVALNDAEAPPSDDTLDTESPDVVSAKASERPSHHGATKAAAAESTPPVTRVAA